MADSRWPVVKEDAEAPDSPARAIITGKFVAVPVETPFDVRDGWAQAGYAENVFVAKVEGYRDTKQQGGALWSTFSVSTSKTLKAPAGAKPVGSVSFMGGFGADGAYFAHANDAPLLVGETYIFWARGTSAEGAVRLIPGHGYRILTEDDRTALSKGETPRAVQSAADAAANAIPYSGK